MEKEKKTERTGAVSANRELDDDDDEEEDEKIDKFYALIRNFREARNRWRKELIITNNHELEMREKNKRKHCNKSSGWTPTFELDDFKQGYLIKRDPLQIFPPPPPTTNNCKKQEEDRDENGLDLKLTL